MGATSDVAAWVAGASFEAMPAEVVERARAGIVDTAKFRDCAAVALEPAQAERALARLGALEREPDVRRLVADLTPAVAATAR